MNVGKYLRGDDRHVGTARVINKGGEVNKRKDTLNGYGEMYRSGITMKEHWATERRIKQDRRGMEKARLGKGLMGKNT